MNGNNINQQTNNQQIVKDNIPLASQTVKSKVINGLRSVVNKLKDAWLKIPERLRKILRIVGIVFAVLLLLIIILSTVLKLKNKVPVEIKPTPVASFEPLPSGEVIINPSRYATDSGVLKIEEDLRNLEKELDNLQVNETNLLPPRLDFDINFDK